MLTPSLRLQLPIGFGGRDVDLTLPVVPAEIEQLVELVYLDQGHRGLDVLDVELRLAEVSSGWNAGTVRDNALTQFSSARAEIRERALDALFAIDDAAYLVLLELLDRARVCTRLGRYGILDVEGLNNTPVDTRRGGDVVYRHLRSAVVELARCRRRVLQALEDIREAQAIDELLGHIWALAVLKAILSGQEPPPCRCPERSLDLHPAREHPPHERRITRQQTSF